jgi:hypothetical protein
MIRPNTRSAKLARLFEGCVKKWRGVARWYLQAHTSARGEAVLQIVSERHSQVSRIDNLFASWRRALVKELQLPKTGSLKRATWTAIGAENYIVDVHVMHDVFDAATAKLWAEIAGAADATRCSYMEPSMPPQVAPTLGPSQSQPAEKRFGPANGPTGLAHAQGTQKPHISQMQSKSSGPDVLTKRVVLDSAHTV